MALATCLSALACSGGGSGSDDDEARSPATTAAPAEGTVFPGAEWARADATDMGFDQAQLDEIAAQAEQAASTCLVVTRQGRIVGEWYWRGTDAASSQEAFSATKSCASTLVGIAQDEGLLDVDDPASAYIDAWAGTDSQDVTIANLLSNDSGRQWDGAIDYTQLPFAPDMNALAVGLTQTSPPGTTWAYNNAAIQTSTSCCQRRPGSRARPTPRTSCWGPSGWSTPA